MIVYSCYLMIKAVLDMLGFKRCLNVNSYFYNG